MSLYVTTRQCVPVFGLFKQSDMAEYTIEYTTGSEGGILDKVAQNVKGKSGREVDGEVGDKRKNIDIVTL